MDPRIDPPQRRFAAPDHESGGSTEPPAASTRSPGDRPARVRREGLPAIDVGDRPVGSRRRHDAPLAGRGPTARERLDARRRGAHARLDELHVDDGGVVILWPFLERLFTRTGLVDDARRFVDEPARAQAIALLGVLARDDPEPPEPTLPLAKVLCGARPEGPFTLERPLDDDQRRECERLLLAVVDHVPALGELAIDDLRATFLQRPAALTIRDGAWSLAVERRPQDLVLDRFPWAWRWIRLPWMAAPLQVEW